ncbi:MAG: hypothetical protein ACTSWN_14905, partial [Promethearchaeota archaeon]
MYIRSKKWDILNSKQTLKLAHAFFSGREIVDLYKRRNNKRKVVSVTFPFSELIFTMDAIPLFLMRYEEFKHLGSDKVLKSITRISKILGWNAIDNIIKLAHLTVMGKSIVEQVIENLIGALIERYHYLTKL